MTNEQFNKLPEYVKRHITTLESKVEYWKGQVSEMCGEADTNTTFTTGLNDSFGLPMGANVRFSVDLGRYVDVSVVGDELRVYGSRCLKVNPRASNSIYIEVDE